MELPKHTPAESLTEPLAERELEIIALLAEGLSNAEIGERLFLAPSTVKWYVRQINSKLYTENRDQIVQRAGELGLLATADPARAKHNLPHQTTPFVGREAELNDLHTLLADPDVRLLTILALGGMGKTRLALEAAEQQQANFSSGVYFVPLQPLSDAEHILPQIAAVINYQIRSDGRTPLQQLQDFLANKQMLLVLDNFEHLLAGASMITNILQAVPGVKVMVTSRERLNLSGEHVYTLYGMGYPAQTAIDDGADYDAVALLLKSIRRVQPVDSRYEAQALDGPTLARICQLVEGMPLALELAGGWTDTLPLAAVADELAQGIGILETDHRDVPPRQRSIRATFGYTWDHLTQAERQAFMALSVFRGGFTLAAAEAVAGADRNMLRRLVNKALVRQIAAERYDVHELLRQFAAAELESDPAMHTRVHDAHCAYYAGLLDNLELSLWGHGQTAAADQIKLDLENVRSAWNWAVDCNFPNHLRVMALALDRFVWLRQIYMVAIYPLFAGALETLAGHAEDYTDERCAYGVILGGFAAMQWGLFSNSEETLRMADESLSIAEVCEDQYEIAARKFSVAFSSMLTQQRLQQALELLDEAVVLFREFGHTARVGECLWCKTLIFQIIGVKRGEIAAIRKECLSLAHQSGDAWLIALLERDVGHDYVFDGQYDRGLACYQKSLQICEQNELDGMNMMIAAIANLNAILGNLEEAKAGFKRAYHIAKEKGGLDASTYLADLALIVSLEGNHEQAATLLEESYDDRLPTRRRQGLVWAQGVLAFRRGAYNDARRYFVERKQSDTISEIIGFAPMMLGLTEFKLGKLQAAVRSLCEGLAATHTTGSRILYSCGIYGFAEILRATGQPERATEIATLVDDNPATEYEFKMYAAELLTQLEAELSPDVYAAAVERGRALDLDATVETLLAEFGERE